jgi:hypothetical protein
LYMLLFLASVVLLGSEFLGARDHILLSELWDFPFCRLLRFAGSRWRCSNPPPHGDSLLRERERVRVTLQLAVYGQLVRLGAKPLETHGQNFSQLNTCGHSPYISSSLTRGWVCDLQWLLSFASAFILGSESRGTPDHILIYQIRVFLIRRLLRLAGLWWRYWTPPPHGRASQVIVKVKVKCLLPEGQSESLGVEPHLGLTTRYLLLFDSYGLVFVGRPLWREDGSVFCICCWPSPAQSFSGPRPLDLATIF